MASSYLANFSIITVLVELYTLYRSLLPSPLPGDPAGLAKWCSKQLEEHGSPICQALMGPLSKPVVLVAHVGQTRELLMRRSDFDRSSYIINRTSRSGLKDLLAPHYLHQTVGPIIHSLVLKLIHLWESKARVANGKPFSMLDSALRRQIEFVEQLDSSQLVIGKHTDVTFPQAPLHLFQQGLTDVGDRMAAIYTTKWPPSIVTSWARNISPSYRKFFVGKDRFIRQHINLALHRFSNEEQPKAGIDYMIYREHKAAREFDRQPMYGKQIMIDEAYGNLIAGQHTTSAALVWILKLLAEHPAIQTRLRDELQTVCVGAVQECRLPTAAKIIQSRLPYLDAVLEETLRLRAAMLVPRDATRNTELLGRPIPKGTVVLLVCQGPDYSSSPSSQYWSEIKTSQRYPGGGNPDLEAFDPQRWLVQNERGELEFDGSSYPQLAFGLGIRACWGRRLAQLEMRILTVMLTWKFDFLDVPEALAGHEATYDISYRAKKGYLRLRSR
ncbi:cytochrome P450 [Aspergillus vadensis CBS 113365]|uniref:Cytochrome P450 n=1 Tax=Aspergillus vadensis (strain CBS 113365 / IMI 142717 / IBT 24658) TaxID=1448311 RepID=A0A319CEX6_ASPVC|nr:cytochrome P450 [Aspergillus vadensis CBS 113365]PYH66912.1 cytochrome P450 [Aspergillus vadensis CBS 113365]